LVAAVVGVGVGVVFVDLYVVVSQNNTTYTPEYFEVHDTPASPFLLLGCSCQLAIIITVYFRHEFSSLSGRRCR
jgi:hypothetical protein